MRPISVRWRNFRGFRDSGWVAFRPLTIVIGPNNSGKTSFHKPLLLLKQTLQADDVNTGLVTRGELASVGGYDDLIFRHQSGSTLSLSIRFSDVHEGAEPARTAALPVHVDLHFKGEATMRVRLEGFEAYDAQSRLLLSRRYRSGSYTVNMHGRPFTLRESEVAADRKAYLKHLEGAVRNQLPKGLVFDSAPVLAALFEDRAHGAASFPRAAMRYLNVVNGVNQGLDAALSSLSYVGPLREPFDRFYQPLGHVPTDVGITGRRAPDIVIARHDEPDFNAWLSRWLREFGFRGGYQVSPATTGVHRIDVRATRKGTAVNIADSGFGLSQVLPFIVHGVHAPENSLLVAEQPEIHLNPRLHRKLADLFAAMVKIRRNVLVETHSEHFVTRIRSLIASGKLSSTEVSLLYVEKRGQQSVVRHVSVNDDGSIAEGDWPQGFFDEAVRDAVELLRARRQIRA